MVLNGPQILCWLGVVVVIVVVFSVVLLLLGVGCRCCWELAVVDVC